MRKPAKTYTKKDPFKIRGRRSGDDDGRDDGHYIPSGVASTHRRRKSPP